MQPIHVISNDGMKPDIKDPVLTQHLVGEATALAVQFHMLQRNPE
jgi:hypothetical protein